MSTASRSVATRDSKRRELAATLTMLASQLQESIDDPRNQMPSPMTFDDWLAAYRDVYVFRRVS